MNNEIKKVILLKYGEVVLKGLNRKHFEAILEKDAVRRLKSCGNYEVKSAQSTMYVTPLDDEALMNIDYTAEQCAKIFGVVSVSVALEIDVIDGKNCQAANTITETSTNEHLDNELNYALTHSHRLARRDCNRDEQDGEHIGHRVVTTTL